MHWVCANCQEMFHRKPDWACELLEFKPNGPISSDTYGIENAAYYALGELK